MPAGAVALVLSCVTPPPRPEWIDPAPRPDSIDAVVLLIGDAGDAAAGRSPVTARLGEEVEHWAGVVGRDSSVAVLFLGDNVYPVGVRDPGSDDFAADSLRLLSQVRTVAGPAARRHAVRGYFLAGNHDWGQMGGAEGLVRLRNEDRLLARFRREGFAVTLVPEPGEPGPVLLDVGTRARILAIDTQWWLQVRDPARQRPVLDRLGRLLERAGPGATVAAHHPWISGGMHGAGHPVPAAGYGVHWLLRRTGALLQDLNSGPYRALRAELGALFTRMGAPLLWVSGHDHSLQVFRGADPDEPGWTLVSGAGSDPTGLGLEEGMVWGTSAPGFMRLTWMRDGAVHLHVLATEDDYAVCEGDAVAIRRCMDAGRARFRVVYAATLRGIEGHGS